MIPEYYYFFFDIPKLEIVGAVWKLCGNRVKRGAGENRIGVVRWGEVAWVSHGGGGPASISPYSLSSLFF